MISAAPAVLNRQQQRSHHSTARLLDAASELIAERGWAGATLAGVGERAGFSRGLVTARFGSKEKLLAALVERIVTRWSLRNVLPRTEGRPGLDAVVVMLDAVREQAERDASALSALYVLSFEAIGPSVELRDRMIEFHRGLRADIAELLRRGLRDGSIRAGTSVEAEAALIVASLRGIAYLWALDPERTCFVEQLKYLIATTRARLTTLSPSVS
jgi:AcrR family transcriptional regulator